MDQRHAGSEILTDKRDGRYVGKDDAMLGRNFAGVHGLACDFIKQDSLCALRVSCLQLECLQVGNALGSNELVEMLDGIRLVFFDADIALVQSDELHQKLAARDQIFRVFKHQSVVRSDERFTFSRVDD